MPYILAFYFVAAVLSGLNLFFNQEPLFILAVTAAYAGALPHLFLYVRRFWNDYQEARKDQLRMFANSVIPQLVHTTCKYHNLNK